MKSFLITYPPFWAKFPALRVFKLALLGNLFMQYTCDCRVFAELGAVDVDEGDGEQVPVDEDDIGEEDDCEVAVVHDSQDVGTVAPRHARHHRGQLHRLLVGRRLGAARLGCRSTRRVLRHRLK